ncbi:cysteine-rich CWC family protein [Foetidibacter luteolus]|uniref:cysteine-rich CWC family protein n=1 Tax=Foetidibacter luteolus TaxID=2608880 RepID=UPI00129B9922|nr:cysteine-rich CWC family protein [Foetidibacter luteolus]
MPAHESKTCPRCQQAFECRVGDVANCQCNGFTFTAYEKAFIAERYSDCLCAACLHELKNKSVLFREKFLKDGNR